jgi:hypothetical protein
MQFTYYPIVTEYTKYFTCKTKTGAIITIGRYRRDHCVGMRELIPEGGDYSWLGEGIPNINKRYKCRTKFNFCRKLATEFLEIMVRDMIETGNVFKLPIQKGANFRIVAKSQAEVGMVLRKKKYKPVDVIESEFQIYNFVFDYRDKYNLYHRRFIKIDFGLYKRMMALVNQGMRYGAK